ncbi:MAG: ABC transporter ATP-binding protein [Planctomycetota bacterium]
MVQVTELTNLAVDLVDVHKTYRKKVHALRGVNVQVRRGEIFGLLGPNGAGKSTLVKIMMTVVRPDRLIGTILGRPLGNRKKLAVTGYLPENHRFPSYLTGAQLLDYYGALAKVPGHVRKKRSAELLERVGMTEWARTRVGEYSKGMMQRLGLAQALINDPEFLVLDEPTDGLDPAGQRAVRQMLLELRSQGKTIFLNSHLLSELEMVCDRVSILINGLVARQGTLRELTEHTVEYRIAAAGDLTAVREAVERCGGKVQGAEITLAGHDADKVNELIDLLRSKGILIESVVPHRFSLEEVFMETLGTARKP